MKRRFLLTIQSLALLATMRLIGCSQRPVIESLGEGSINVEDSTPQFASSVDRHRRNATCPFVYISWFPHPNSEELAQINVAGAGVKGWVQAGGTVGPLLLVRLNPAALNQVRSLLKELPPSGENISQHSAVILTYQDGIEFRTRVYDRFALPTPVHRIWHVIVSPGMAMDCGPAIPT